MSTPAGVSSAVVRSGRGPERGQCWPFAAVLVLAAVVLTALVGCQRREAPSAGASEVAARGYLDHAQPPLPTLRLWLGDQELVTEIARSAVEVQTGMMFRTNIAEHEAMLFVFPGPFRASFYMRNTKVPLSCAYLDPEGTILELHDLKPLDETPVEAASDRVQYVLETAQGWFQRHHVGVGAVVGSQYGVLRAVDWTTLQPWRRGR